MVRLLDIPYCRIQKKMVRLLDTPIAEYSEKKWFGCCALTMTIAAIINKYLGCRSILSLRGRVIILMITILARLLPGTNNFYDEFLQWHGIFKEKAAR